MFEIISQYGQHVELVYSSTKVGDDYCLNL